jgi:hypothetical protein
MPFFSSVRGTSGAFGRGAAPATSAGQVTTFLFTNADQTYTVPAGVTSIYIALWGAGGSAGTPDSAGDLGGPGGGGGSVEGTMSVTPGETLTVRVGEGIDYPTINANGGNTSTTWSSLNGVGVTAFGGGGVNGFGDGAGQNAGTAGYGGGATSIIRSGSFIARAAGGGGGAGVGYSTTAQGQGGGGGGTGSGTGGTGRGTAGTFTSGQGTYAGYPGTNGGGGGGGGGSGSTAGAGNGDPGQGGANVVPSGVTGYNAAGAGSTTPANASSVYYPSTPAGYPQQPGIGMDRMTGSSDPTGAGHGYAYIRTL